MSYLTGRLKAAPALYLLLLLPFKILLKSLPGVAILLLALIPKTPVFFDFFIVFYFVFSQNYIFKVNNRYKLLTNCK